MNRRPGWLTLRSDRPTVCDKGFLRGLDMRVSTRFLLTLVLLTGLWTWSGAAALCQAGIELSAASTCCPEDCQCAPSACGCSVAPAEPRSGTEDTPVLLPESFQPSSEAQLATLHPGALSLAADPVEPAESCPAFAAKHTDVLLELLCVHLI